MPEDVEKMFEIGMDAVGIGGALGTMDDIELQALFSE
jgi:putative N-acetylmannosamine-6-phosphate epimerase